MEKFCDYQTKCKEDTEDTFTCTAHLHDGSALQCPYKSFTEAKRRDMIMNKYPCEDARKINY